jgi:hypothetical protein
MRTGKKLELGFWYREKRLAVQIGSGESLMLRAGSFSWREVPAYQALSCLNCNAPCTGRLPLGL